MQVFNTLNRETGYNIRCDSKGKCIASNKTREKLKKSQIKRYKNKEERIRCAELSRKAHIDYPESFYNARTKLAYINRKYRIAKCDKNTGNIIKIYEIVNDILVDNPDFYLQTIKGCCQGTKRSYEGYKWHYCDLEEEKLILKGMFISK